MSMLVYELAARLRDELSAQLDHTRAGAPCMTAVHPGEMTPHYGCECHAGEGMAWVRVGPMWPTAQFPLAYEAPLPVGPTGWAATLELGVVRCYPGTEDNSMPPLADLDSAARDALDDALAMQRAAACAFERGTQVIPGMWEPRGPSGGVHGGTLQITVLVDVACGCGQDAPQLDSVVAPLPGDPRFG